HADEPGDPHSPHVDDKGRKIGGIRGFLHSHNGWLFDDTMTDNSHYAKDMLADPFVMFITRTRWFWYALSLVVLPGLFGYALGGVHHMIGCILIAGFFRTYFVIMCSVSVGSFGHWFGSQRFKDVGDESRNNWILAAITFGEGWHNNHHRYPRNAYAGLAWYEIDLNGIFISALEKLGLVWKVVRTPGSEEHFGVPFETVRRKLPLTRPVQGS
ncbi:MAG: fatty acid desaturase, partial [Beijerinckiaceae bacterium]|nr:fatty acid desaturase [Beijerinckiaceae bacterium]